VRAKRTSRAQVFPEGHSAQRTTQSLDRLYRRDGMHFVPTMVRIENICARHLISPADHGFKVGAVVSAAGLFSVCLPYFPLAYWFENEITLLSQDVLLIKERFKLVIQTKSDVEVAVRFFANLVHGACYGNAGFQNAQPAGIVDIVPETLVALCSSCLRGLLRLGDLRRMPCLIHKESGCPKDQKYYDRFHSLHSWGKRSLARHSV
jgi:hypothetical protein